MADIENISSIPPEGAPQEPEPSLPQRKAPTVNEVVAALEGMGLALGYDKLANAPTKTGLLPWDEAATSRPWAELDDAELFALLQGKLGLKSEKALACATTIYMHRHSYDPLTTMLDGFRWDGVERVGTLLAKYLGVEHAPPTQPRSSALSSAGASSGLTAPAANMTSRWCSLAPAASGSLPSGVASP